MEHLLDPYELRIISEQEHEQAEIMRAIEIAKSFNLGDYIVQKRMRYTNQTGAMEITLNSYGAPRKAQVVHIDKHGMAWFKDVNNHGKPSGSLYSMYECIEGTGGSQTYELDPEYAEAIIMGSTDEYVPNALSKERSSVVREINKHNASLKVKFANIEAGEEFLKTLKVGDSFWGSSTRQYVVISTEIITKPTKYDYDSKWMQKIPGPTTVQVVLMSKGKEEIFNANKIWCKAIYTGKPRSHSEIKN